MKYLIKLINRITELPSFQLFIDYWYLWGILAVILIAIAEYSSKKKCQKK